MTLTFYSDTHSQLSAKGLDENSIKVLQYVLQNGSITNTQVKQLLNVSKPTATRILQNLQSKLERIGITGKGTSYILKGSQTVHKGLTISIYHPTSLRTLRSRSNPSITVTLTYESSTIPAFLCHNPFSRKTGTSLRPSSYNGCTFR